MSKKKSASSKPLSPRVALTAALDSKNSSASRSESLRRSVSSLVDREGEFAAVLGILQDVEDPVEVRLAALQSLQAASFLVAKFAPYRSAYVAALRKLSADPNVELRQQALTILAAEQDGPTQRKLLAGLEDPDRALVPPEKALQLLSYDVHAEAYDAARKVVDDPPNVEAREAALRLLAADASSAPLFEKLLKNKSESSEVRQLCAVALQGIRPQKYQEYAREIVLDANEDDSLRSQCLTGLAHFGNAEELANDSDLYNKVEKLKAIGPAKVKQSARQFLKKYGK